MSYAIVTFGCRVNQADSLAIEDGLRARGVRSAPIDDADLVVINTCSVTASADQAARQTIRRVNRVNPSARVIVTGCYATRKSEEASGLPGVTRVITNSEKDNLPGTIDDLLERGDATRDGDGPCGTTLAPGVAGRTTFTLRVQTGCNEPCSYCIIPSTRGASRSKTVDAIVRDVNTAIAAGYKEVVLTGVHLGSYGRDLAPPSSVLHLLSTLAAVDPPAVFRVSSLEPMDCSDAIVDLMGTSPRFAQHFHLPLQHGSDAMLTAMRRPYTASYYRRLVERIAEVVPDAAIGSDIIVGFPGETDAQFDEMLQLLDVLPLAYLHVFPYSDRPGTPASALTPKVDGRVIRARGAAVRELAARKSDAFRQRAIGRELRALTVDDGQSVVTGNYLKLRLDVPHVRNAWVDVRVTSDREAALLGVA